jgi:hypothetical protein
VLGERTGERFPVRVDADPSRNAEAEEVLVFSSNLLVETALGDLANKAAALAESREQFDAEVVVCESDARTKVVSELARNLGLKYVPFRIVFVEGVLTYSSEGDESATTYPVAPAWISVGDYDNVLLYHKMGIKHPSIKNNEDLRSMRGRCDMFKAKGYGKDGIGSPPRVGHHDAEQMGYQAKYQEALAAATAGSGKGYLGWGARVAVEKEARAAWASATAEEKAAVEAKFAAEAERCGRELKEWQAKQKAKTAENEAAFFAKLPPGTACDLHEHGFEEYGGGDEGDLGNSIHMGLRVSLDTSKRGKKAKGAGPASKPGFETDHCLSILFDFTEGNRRAPPTPVFLS